MKQNSILTDKILFYALMGLLFLMPLVYFTYAFDIFGSPKLLLLRVAGAILLSLLIINWYQGKLTNPLSSPIFIAITIFVVIQLLATVFSVNQLISLIGLRRRYFGLSTIIALYIIFLAVSLRQWSKKEISFFLQAIVYSAAFVALIGIAQALGSTFPYDLKQNFGATAYSTFGNPNFTGIYLVMSLPLALSLWRQEKNYYKIFYLLIVLLQITGLILTNSSGALLGGAAAITIYFLAQYKPWQKIGRGQFIVITLLLAGLVSAGAFLVISNEPASVTARARIWRASSRLIGANPILGVGPDAMRYQIPKYLASDKTLNKEQYDDSHNLFLTIAGTSGLPGLFTFLALLFVAGKSLIKKLSADNSSRTLAAALLASGGGYLAAEMVNPDDLVPMTIFWFILGLTASLTYNSGKRLNPNTAAAATAPALLLAVFLTILAGRNFLAETLLLKAEQSQDLNSIVTTFQRTQAAFPYYDWYYIRLSDRLTGLVGQGDRGAFLLSKKAAVTAQKLAPLDADNFVALGTIYRQWAVATADKSYARLAIEQYHQALNINPYNLFALYDLALTYADLGDNDEAEKWANRLREKAPEAAYLELKKELLQH